MKKLLYLISVLTFILISCNNELSINGITVYPESVTIEEGDSMRINAIINFSGGNYNQPDLIQLAWDSDNGDVVSVDSTGYIRALTVGSANVSVTCEDKSAQCAVTVTPKTEDEEDEL